MKYYLIAGEASGDLHGSHLMAALKEVDSNFQARFWGGDLMANQGGIQVQHYRDTAFMGFIEVLKNLGKIRRFFAKAKSDIEAYNPDVIIFVDYPGFNLRMAKWAKEKGFKTVYYITPTVWAWNKSRVHKIKKFIDLAIPILPFEKPFLDKFGVTSVYHGHPLVDIIGKFEPNPKFDHSDGRPIVAILPGSRLQEIGRLLPVMLQAGSQLLPHYKLLIAALRSIDDDIYYQAIAKQGISSQDVELVYDHTYDLVHASSLALVKSGTATLEVALLNKPQIVCYIGSAISVRIAKFVLDIKYISLPNLIMDRAIVKELIQDDCTAKNIVNEIQYITQNRQKMIDDYSAMKEVLGSQGCLSKIATNIYNHFK
jgi:lipid-A-disaccharide synthase